MVKAIKSMHISARLFTKQYAWNMLFPKNLIKLKGKVTMQKIQLTKFANVLSVAVLRMLLLLFSREQCFATTDKCSNL